MMALKAAAFLVGVMVLVFGTIAAGVWIRELLKRRNTAILDARQDRADRTKGLALVVEDRTADDCPSVALADHGGGYACELDREHPLPHRNGVWVWDYEDDIQIDLGAVGDLAAEVNRETLGIWPNGCVWPSCTVADGGPPCTPDEPACEPTCDYVWGDHVCENAPGHTGQHDCPDCGAWIIDLTEPKPKPATGGIVKPGQTLYIGNGDMEHFQPTPTLREESIRCQAKYHYGLDSHYLCDLDIGHSLPHADSREQVRVRWYGIGADEQVTLW